MTQVTIGERSWQPVPVAWVLMPRELETVPRPRCGSWVEKTSMLLAAVSSQPAGTCRVRGFQLRVLQRDHLQVGSCLWFGHVCPLAFTWSCSERVLRVAQPCTPRSPVAAAPKGTGSGCSPCRRRVLGTSCACPT